MKSFEEPIYTRKTQDELAAILEAHGWIVIPPKDDSPMDEHREKRLQKERVMQFLCCKLVRKTECIENMCKILTPGIRQPHRRLIIRALRCLTQRWGTSPHHLNARPVYVWQVLSLQQENTFKSIWGVGEKAIPAFLDALQSIDLSFNMGTDHHLIQEAWSRTGPT